MARPLRLEYAGALHHVTNRGVEQRDIFLDDIDRTRFVGLLAQVIHKTGWALYAWVLMTNHYHLLVETPEPNLSRGMKDLDGDYASAFNARHGRVGHLFQGRFKNKLIETDSYLLTVARYVVLNPVRARMAESAGAWPWSSYRATAGLSPTPGWLRIEPLLARFHPDPDIAMAAYRELVARANTASPWDNLVSGLFLGSKAFLRRMEMTVRIGPDRPDIRRDQGHFRATTPEDVCLALDFDPVKPTSVDHHLALRRDAFVLLIRRHTNIGLAEIGRVLGITGAGAAHVLRRAEGRLQRDTAFADFVSAAERRLG